MAPRRLLRPVLPLLLLALIGACASEERPEDGKPRLQLWTMQLKPTYTEFMTGLIEGWKRAHPDAEVEWVDLPANEIENKTLTAAAGGNPPDVVNLNPAFTSKLAQAGALSPVQLPEAERSAFFPAAWQANVYEGQALALPWYLSTAISLYNREIWEKAGLKVGDWPTRYDQLGAIARTIKAKTGQVALMPNFGDRGKFMEILAQEGVPLLEGGKPAFDTPKGRSVIRYWAGLVKEGLIPREALTQGHREAIDRFQAGQTALFPAGPQFLGMIQSNSPQLFTKLELGPPLSGASGKVGLGVMNLAILKSSKQQPLALDLARHLSSAENQLAFCKLVPILPSRRAVARDPYFQAKPDSPLADRARALAASQLERAEVLVPSLPRQGELAKALDEALQRAGLGAQEPEASLNQAKQEWDRILSRP